MPTHASGWWTEDRIEATVDRAFILAQLTPDERKLLEQSISFGGGLTDDTYLDWILERAKRFFLILVEIGVPDQIFGLVDESYDDADLPIALSAVRDLRLTQDPDGTLDKKFYKTQFKFLVRNITEGQNLQYTEEETIPVETVGLKAGIVPLGKDGTDKVRLSNHYEVFARKRVPLNQPPNHISESDVVFEIQSLRKLAHQHLASVYASYSHGDSIYVLLTPASEYTLKSFIADTPKHFDNLPKSERREILINWPHCLANGLDWLHTKGVPHGAVRPSNVLVDSSFRIFLGQCDSFNITHSSFKTDDVEIYQYAAPEKWKRAAKVQTSGPGKVALPSGGRAGRKQSDGKVASNATDANRNWPTWAPNRISTSRSSMDTVKATSTALPPRPSSQKSSSEPRSDTSSTYYESSFTSSGSSGVASRNSSDNGRPLTSRLRAHTHGKQPPSIAASIVTTDTSGNSNAARSVLREPVILAPPEVRTTIVQTWHSAGFDPLPTDVFALGAVIADILTLLCKRSSGAFSRFRSAKNRTAGRGGGLADASFHANIGQVLAWLTLLVHDSKRKATKDDGKVLGAVEPMVDVLKASLEREPGDRIKAHDLEKRLGDCIWYSANVGKLHCYKALQALAPPKSPSSPIANRQPARLPLRDRPRTPDVGGQSNSNESDMKQSSKRADSAEGHGEDNLSRGPDSSFESLSSFNFEYEFNPGRSDASIDKDTITAIPDHNLRHHTKSSAVGDERVAGMRVSQKKDRGHSWDNWHNNDSSTDPSLAPSSNPGKAYTDFVHDSSNSDDDHQKSFLLPESRRASMAPPLGPLPAPPEPHGEGSNPQSTTRQSRDHYGGQLKRTPRDDSVREQRPANPRAESFSRNSLNRPNSSRARTNRSVELLKADELERSMNPDDVERQSGIEPAYVMQSLEGTSNFSRPRVPSVPGQRQAQESGKSYLKNV